MHESLEIIISDLIDFFKPNLKGINSVLDIGTGSSIPIHTFADKFPSIKYNTVDIVDIRKRKILPFAIYNGNHLPFGNSEFDVSVLNETLHHCEEPLSVLTEAGRVAKFVYVIEHFPDPGVNAEELIDSEKKALRNFDLDCKIYKPFTEESLCSLFKEAGLTIQNRVEIPYRGNRRIRKYFFKLKR